MVRLFSTTRSTQTVRLFSTTRLTQTPPKYALPTKYKGVKFPDGWSKTPVYKRVVTPNIASPSKLALPPLTWSDIMSAIPTRTHTTPTPQSHVYNTVKEYYRRSQDPIRFLQPPPVPTTFPLLHASDVAPLSADPLHYPYTYYRVVLMRGLIGLELKTRSITHSLGLHVRGQVVYKRINASTAGKILKIKELVKVKLVNEIPPIYSATPGYVTLHNAIGQAV